MKKTLLLFFVSATMLGMNQEEKSVRSSGLIARLKMFDPDELVDNIDEQILGPMSHEEKAAIKTCEHLCECGCALVGPSVACCMDYSPCTGVFTGLAVGKVCGNLSALYLIWNVRPEKEKPA